MGQAKSKKEVKIVVVEPAVFGSINYKNHDFETVFPPNNSARLETKSNDKNYHRVKKATKVKGTCIFCKLVEKKAKKIRKTPFSCSTCALLFCSIDHFDQWHSTKYDCYRGYSW